MAALTNRLPKAQQVELMLLSIKSVQVRASWLALGTGGGREKGGRQWKEGHEWLTKTVATNVGCHTLPAQGAAGGAAAAVHQERAGESDLIRRRAREGLQQGPDWSWTDKCKCSHAHTFAHTWHKA